MRPSALKESDGALNKRNARNTGSGTGRCESYNLTGAAILKFRNPMTVRQ